MRREGVVDGERGRLQRPLLGELHEERVRILAVSPRPDVLQARAPELRFRERWADGRHLALLGKGDG